MLWNWQQTSIWLALSLLYCPHLHAFMVSHNRYLSTPQTSRYAKAKKQVSTSTKQPTKQTKRTTTSASASGKKSTTSSKNEKTKNRSNDGKIIAPKKQSSSSFLPETRSRAPPWQIMNKSAQAQNIATEQKRRQIASQNGASVSSEDNELDSYSETSEPVKSSSKASPSSPTFFRSDSDQRLFHWKRFSPSKTKTKLSLVGSYLHKQIPPKLGVPEIAFLGRSNVGKSSLLNRLTLTQLARVGKTPGATATVNLYALLKASASSSSSTATSSTFNPNQPPLLGLIDLPGFGYAKLSRERQDAVQMAAEAYLSSRSRRGASTGELALAILLIDARRIPSEEDASVLAALYDMGIPLVVVATKLDQVVVSSQSKQNPDEDEQWTNVQKPKIAQRLGLPKGQPLGISSKTGQGISELWNIILDACESKVEEFRSEMTNEKDNPPNDDEDEIEVPSDSFEDSEDIMYDQGYDWIQDSVNWYDGDDIEEDEELDDNDESISSDPPQNVQMTFQALRKLARKMEQRGEV
jgi:GTP-binding protein